MFNRVMEWLEADPETRGNGFDEESIRLSIAALFYHMIAVDGVVTDAEVARLRLLLRERFHLSNSQISCLSEHGKSFEENASGLFPFAFILNRELSWSERREIYRQMESLAMADDVLHPLEEELLMHMHEMLKLDNVDLSQIAP